MINSLSQSWPLLRNLASASLPFRRFASIRHSQRARCHTYLFSHTSFARPGKNWDLTLLSIVSQKRLRYKIENVFYETIGDPLSQYDASSMFSPSTRVWRV